MSEFSLTQAIISIQFDGLVQLARECQAKHLSQQDGSGTNDAVEKAFAHFLRCVAYDAADVARLHSELWEASAPLRAALNRHFTPGQAEHRLIAMQRLHDGTNDPTRLPLFLDFLGECNGKIETNSMEMVQDFRKMKACVTGLILQLPQLRSHPCWRWFGLLAVGAGDWLSSSLPPVCPFETVAEVLYWAGSAAAMMPEHRGKDLTGPEDRS